MSPNRILSNVHEVFTLTPSITSSSSSSPTLLQPEPSDVRSSLGSSQGTPSVKFAPLPQIDPGRKRSLVPLGVSGRSRRKQIVQREAGSLSWCRDPDALESVEDPLVAFTKFVKKTGKTLWQRVRKSSKAVPPEDVDPVLDIKSTSGFGEEVDGRDDRASWSPSVGKRRSHSLDEAKRRSTSDLTRLRVVV